VLGQPFTSTAEFFPGKFGFNGCAGSAYILTVLSTELDFLNPDWDCVRYRMIKALVVDGTAPTLANVSSGKYPYALTMSVVYKRDKYRGSIKDFIDFVFSGEGQKLLSANGHVTIHRMIGK
jgi:ABC-type phosphate transport system substrate-binding protein